MTLLVYQTELFTDITVNFVLDQGFPTWGTCTHRGTFAYLKGYI